MSRIARIAYPGAMYHVTCRMVGSWVEERNRLFMDDSDRERFLMQVSERVDAFNILLYQFCLMTTHAHLVFETPLGNVSAFMHSLNTAYCVYYNRRHKRHGHLLDGRFGGKLVEKNEYIQALSRYVHLNPVATAEWEDRPLSERRKALRSYRWSSYPGYIGLRKPLEFVMPELLWNYFPGPKKDRPREYRKYVELGLVKTDAEFEESLSCSTYAIGSAGFIDKVRESWVAPENEMPNGESRSKQLPANRVDPKRVLTILADQLGETPEVFRERRRNSPIRAFAAGLLRKYSGMAQRETGVLLDLKTSAAVSVQLRKLPEWLNQDKAMNRLYKNAEEVLEQEDSQEAWRR